MQIRLGTAGTLEQRNDGDEITTDKGRTETKYTSEGRFPRHG